MSQHTSVHPGAVHVFDRPTLGWQRTLSAASPRPGDFFGHALAVSGTTLVVGAPGDDTDAARGGAAHLFDLATGHAPRRIANPNAPFVYDSFGFAVAALPDRIVVGAPHDNTAEEVGWDAAFAGTAYVFDLDGTLLQTLLGSSAPRRTRAAPATARCRRSAAASIAPRNG